MTRELTQRASALIEHIQTRFHDGHRRALPELLTMAAAVEANGVETGLVDALRVIGDELERHMFKEEMRLFPMMEQGGNPLIGGLIEDLHREHVMHGQVLDELRTRLRLVGESHRTDRLLHELIQGVDDFASELTSHIHVEDQELFPLFAVPMPLAASAALKPDVTSPARP